MLSRLANLTIRWLSISSIALIILLTSFNNPALASMDLDLGAKVFKANCAGCHVNGGNIIRRGKNLKSKALHKHKVDTQEAISSLVINGRGIMSAYGDKLTPEEINNVSAYVLQRAEQNWK